MDLSSIAEMPQPTCSAGVDNVFGPSVEDCARAFDFTLLFEETMLSILPSSIFIISSVVRVAFLSRRKANGGGDSLRHTELSVIAVLLAISVSLVALWSLDRTSSTRTQTSVPAAVLSMIESIVFMVISFIESRKCIRPPLLLDGYLLLSILFDAVRARTLWIKQVDLAISVLFSISIGTKLVVFILEEISKRQQVVPEGIQWSKEETAGVVSLTFFAWLNRLLWAGYSGPLILELLPNIDHRLLSQSLWRRVSPRLEGTCSGGSSLPWTIFYALKWSLLAPVIPYLLSVALQLAQPFLVHATLDYLGSTYDGSESQKNIGYGLVGAYGLVYLSIAATTAWGQHLTYRFTVMLRGALVTAIYRKTMSVSLSVAADASAVTLMSTDVERIVQGISKIHDAWSTLIQVAVAMFLLYRQIGVVFIAPVILSALCSVGAIYTSSFAGKFQGSWMSAIERRVGITSSLLGNIKSFKMLGWANKLEHLLQQLRLTEIASAANFRLILLVMLSIAYTPVLLAPVVAFGSHYGLVHQGMGSKDIFTTLTLLVLITQPLDLLFDYVPEILAAFTCFSRIQEYLRREPVAASSPIAKNSLAVESFRETSSDDDHEKSSGSAIVFKDASFGWSVTDKPLLSSVDLCVPNGKLSVVTGPVACGKSTLLYGILGETTVSQGSVRLSSRNISFCDQTAWMANVTLRENITGSTHFDSAWYGEVVRACALEEDIAQFPEGDQASIGSNGISLSGGQKQRVAIARAVYSKPEIALFDDVFSGLDMETQSRILRNIFGPRGIFRQQGTTTVFVTHSENMINHADLIINLSSKDNVVTIQTREQITLEGDIISPLDSVEVAEGKESIKDSHVYKPVDSKSSAKTNDLDGDIQRLGDGAVYKYYFQTVGTRTTLTFVALALVLVTCLKFPEVILSWWGDANDRQPTGDDNVKYLAIYTALQVATLFLLAATCGQVLLNLVVKSGRNLHMILLRSTLRAPLSFFSSADVGSITNRFSQDITLVDSELPFSLINFACNGLLCVAQALMIIPASVWLLISYPFLFGGVWLLQRYYLRTSRQLRFLDLDAKSPIYDQFLETLKGVATIRAFGWQDRLVAELDERLDVSQKPFYLLLSIQRWLNLVLDLIAAFLAILLVLVAVLLRNYSTTGFAGIALYNIVSLSAAMKSAVRAWTNLETSIGAVARIKNFADSTPNENLPGESQKPEEGWPQSGSIAFENVTASYKSEPSSTPAISDLSLTIKPGEKIGLCGRSGSGKTSILLALLHVIEYTGSITVDGVKLSHVSRELLRGCLNVLPQDAVLLAGTIRFNCDPDSLRTDAEIIEALSTVQLWKPILAKGGLDAEISADFFSQGQNQLFSLGRALLSRSRVLLMDEASSSIDLESERLVMSIVKERCENITVISIAHRLETLMDFDRVMVVDNGRIIEEGNPRHLLSFETAFKSLYESSQKASS